MTDYKDKVRKDKKPGKKAYRKKELGDQAAFTERNKNANRKD